MGTDILIRFLCAGLIKVGGDDTVATPWRRYLLVGLFALSCLALPRVAQANGAGGVTIGPRLGSAALSQTCVDGEKASPLDCINKDLKQQVDRVHPMGNEAPTGASLPASRIGIPTNPTSTAIIAIDQFIFQKFLQAAFPRR